MSEGGGGGWMSEMIIMAIMVAGIGVMILGLVFALAISFFLQPILGSLTSATDNYLNKELLPKFTEMIALNPDISIFRPFVADLIKIIALFYVVGILLLAIYIILVSHSPHGRARAKGVLLRMLFGLCVVPASLEIFGLFLSLGDALTRRLLIYASFSGGGYYFATTAFAGFFFIVPLVVTFAYVVVGLRYVFVCVMAVLFPLSLFLYFFELTRGTGANLMRFTLLGIFTQPVMALMLIITISIFDSMGNMSNPNIGSQLMLLVAGMAGFIMIAAAPLLMLGLMAWLGGAMAGAGMIISYKKPMVGGALVALGGLGAGMGPEALVIGYSARTLGEHALTNQASAERRAQYVKYHRETKGVDPTAEEIWTHTGHHMDENIKSLEKEGVRKGMSSRDIDAWVKEEVGPWAVTQHDAELRSVRSMLPYPASLLYKGSQYIPTPKRVGRFIGTAQTQGHITAVNNATTVNEVSAATKKALTSMGADKRDVNGFVNAVEQSGDVEKAKEYGRSAIVFRRIQKDKFAGLDDKFFGPLGREIQQGDTSATNLDRMAQRLKAEGHNYPTTHPAEDTVPEYIKKYKDLYNVQSNDDNVNAIMGAYNKEVNATASKMSPDEIAYYKEVFKEVGEVEFRLDLGSNLHARMLLEDYMGIGPRPSEFYPGIGDEAEVAKAEKRREGDKTTWEKL